MKHFKEKVEELRLIPDQIYNADGSGVFWKMLPNKIFLSSKEASTSVRIVSEDRINFMSFSNANGMHKLDLWEIGKAKNSRAFTNICRTVCYRNQEK